MWITRPSSQAVLMDLLKTGDLMFQKHLAELKLDYKEVIAEDYRGMAKKVFGKFFPTVEKNCDHRHREAAW